MEFNPRVQQPRESAFTCNSCMIKFVTADLQRLHMKTEWHRYNLKRRVAELAPVSSDVFATKFFMTQETRADEDEFGFHVHQRRRGSGGRRQVTKKDLRRQQRFQRVYEDEEVVRDSSPASSVATDLSRFSLGRPIDLARIHSHGAESSAYDTLSEAMSTDYELISESEARQSDSDEGSSNEDEEQGVDVTECIYCGKDNCEIERNVVHMAKYHGLFIPERGYLSDLEGLLQYLGGKVILDYECITCGFEGKGLESIRQHAVAKGHCRMPFETKEDRRFFSQFYDFSSLSEDAPKKKSVKSVAFADADETIVEDDSEDSEDDCEDHFDDDTAYSLVQIADNGIEMRLPTGVVVGHKSMSRYWRQNPRIEREVPDSEKTVALVQPSAYEMSRERYLGREEKSSNITAVNKRSRDLKRSLKMGNQQQHFRPQL